MAQSVRLYKGEKDPLKPPKAHAYYIAPNDGLEIQAMFRKTQAIHLLTAHNVTYMLFPILDRPRKEALQVLSLAIDLIVQEFPCGDNLNETYKKEALWTELPRFIILALVKVDTTDKDYQKMSFLSQRFFDRDVPVCPIAFLLCKDRSPGNGLKAVYSHLEILCSSPPPPVGGVGNKFSTGHILIYHMLNYALKTLKQDVELAAMDDSPFLIKYYASHGFILCDQYLGCKQLTSNVIAKFDSEMARLLKEEWNADTRIQLLKKLGLTEQQVIIRTEDGEDKVGWYMLFCRDHEERLELSKKKADDLMAAHDKVPINLASTKVFKGTIKFRRRDYIFREFQDKYNIVL